MSKIMESHGAMEKSKGGELETGKDCSVRAHCIGSRCWGYIGP